MKHFQRKYDAIPGQATQSEHSSRLLYVGALGSEVTSIEEDCYFEFFNNTFPMWELAFILQSPENMSRLGLSHRS